MKRLIIVLALLLVPAIAFSGKDLNVYSAKKKFKAKVGKSKLFKVTDGIYDKRPELNKGMNIYIMDIKVKDTLGEGVFTFVKYPFPKAGQKKNDVEPLYRTLTLTVYDKNKSRSTVEKHMDIPLHMKSDETLAVYTGQKLTVTWLGDGSWGLKGFHFYAYNEKIK